MRVLKKDRKREKEKDRELNRGRETEIELNEKVGVRVALIMKTQFFSLHIFFSLDCVTAEQNKASSSNQTAFVNKCSQAVFHKQ